MLSTGILLAGCATDPLAEQYRAGSNKNYIAGDGSVMEIPQANRGEAIVYTGIAQDGSTVSSSDYAGQVQVVNFWYAGCAPCRAEADELEQVAQASANEGVSFVGVNVRDQALTAETFMQKFGISYPSIIDQNGQVQLAFSSNVPPNAVPTTLVLDRQGRVAARVLGQITEASILQSLIDTVAKAVTEESQQKGYPAKNESRERVP